ncbi:MAG: MBL fold metallo-hydrolase [Sandaracinaceae bacterium]
MAEIVRELTDLGDGVFAYTQLPGSWGWSNAGLVIDGDQSLLVDTLFDRKLTGEMLDRMRRAAPAAARIDRVVNTHGNGDHCYGNGLVADAEIIATRACVDELRDAPPGRNATLLRAARALAALGPAAGVVGRAGGALGLRQLEWLVDAAPFALPLFGAFEFAGNEVTLPNRTFEGTLTLRVGDKTVRVVEVGPAHTRGDAFVHVVDDRVVFTGDLLFKNAHPIVWAGPVSNWVAALRGLLEEDIETVVPGHGPVTDRAGIQETIDYLELLTAEARARYDAGLSLDDAVKDIRLDAWRGWLDAERVYVNVRTLYREFAGEEDAEADILELFAKMARYRDGRL